MKYTKQLTKISEELEAYNTAAFDDSTLEGLVLDLEAINEEFDDSTSDADFALYDECHVKVAVAERFFEDVYAQEERDQRIDEGRYESYRHLQ
jgi:hypothetical protein